LEYINKSIPQLVGEYLVHSKANSDEMANLTLDSIKGEWNKLYSFSKKYPTINTISRDIVHIKKIIKSLLPEDIYKQVCES